MRHTIAPVGFAVVRLVKKTSPPLRLVALSVAAGSVRPEETFFADVNMLLPVPAKPKGWFGHFFIQTMLVNFQPRAHLFDDIHAEPLQIALRDTTDILLATAYWQPKPAPTIIIVPGVGGSSDSAYARRTVLAALASGMQVVALNLRGAGAGAPYAKRMYHAGLISDIEDTVMALDRHPAVRAMSLLGFSLGGQIALKFLARGASPVVKKIHAAATVSAPFDLAATCKRLDAGSYRPFRSHVLVGLARNLTGLQPGAVLPIAPAKARRLKYLQAFDDLVTAPMHGFRDASDYYEQVSCGKDLHAIDTPTLSIHASDDPMISLDSLTPSRSRATDAMQFVWSEHGGHCGFVEDWRAPRRSWAVDRSVAFLRSHSM